MIYSCEGGADKEGWIEHVAFGGILRAHTKTFDPAQNNWESIESWTKDKNYSRENNMRSDKYFFITISIIMFNCSCSMLQSDASKNCKTGSATVLCIEVSKEGDVYAYGGALELSSLDSFITYKARKKQLSDIVIKGEKGTNFDVLIPFVDIACKSGIQSVKLQLTDIPIKELSRPLNDQD